MLVQFSVETMMFCASIDTGRVRLSGIVAGVVDSGVATVSVAMRRRVTCTRRAVSAAGVHASSTRLAETCSSGAFQRNSAMLSGYMGKSEVFDEALADFAAAYADQNEKDHAALDPRCAPAPAAVARTVGLAAKRGLAVDTVTAALALARHGTAPDAVAHLSATRTPTIHLEVPR